MMLITRSLAATAAGAALVLLLATPMAAPAAGQVDVQAMMMDNFIKISAAGVGLAVVCGASDDEVQQVKARQKQQLRDQQGTLPDDFDQRFDAAVAARVAQAKQLSPAQRQQACEEFTKGMQELADQSS